jgi:hypothetical protein
MARGLAHRAPHVSRGGLAEAAQQFEYLALAAR